jgi:hypothetical protein
MWKAVVAAGMLMIAGCAPSKACIGLLEKAEGKYRDSLAEARRPVPDADSDSKWKAVLHDFGQVQSMADEGQRKYTVLKREDPDKSELLRKELEAVNYFQRFGTVYSCALRMQGIALANLGSPAYAEQKKKAGDAAAQEAEQRYKYSIDCGYPVSRQP